MSARTQSHSPTTVDSLDTLSSAESYPPPGPKQSIESEPAGSFNLLRSAGQYDSSCFEQTFDTEFSARTGSEAPWMEYEPPPPPLSRSLSGVPRQ